MNLYQFEDGKFEFFTAVNYGKPPGPRPGGAPLRRAYGIIFRVRADSWPEKRAREKNIAFGYLRPSSVKEIEKWMETHPDYPVRSDAGPQYLGSEKAALDALIKQEVAIMMKEAPETLYWSGGTDCGIEDCVEHAHLRKQDDTVEGGDKREAD